MFGDCCGRYPLPDDNLKAICEDVNTVKVKVDEILVGTKKITDSQPSATINANESIYTASNGENYAVTDQDEKKIVSLNKEIEEQTNKISPADFGVYSSESINLELYSDIISSFDID